MKYSVRINKRTRNVRVYRVVKKVAGNPNAMTKFFTRIFTRQKKEEY